MNYVEKWYKNIMKNGGSGDIAESVWLVHDKENNILKAHINFSGLPSAFYVINGRRKDVIKKEIEAAVKDYFLKQADNYSVKWKI